MFSTVKWSNLFFFNLKVYFLLQGNQRGIAQEDACLYCSVT